MPLPRKKSAPVVSQPEPEPELVKTKRQKKDERPPRPKEVFESLPIEGWGPPPLREGDGLPELSTFSPEHVLTLDYASFMWLWRIAEARALAHQQKHAAIEAQKLVQQVSLRTALAFRRSAGQVEEKPAQPTRKSLIRKSG